jgi:hypothetical protein
MVVIRELLQVILEIFHAADLFFFYSSHSPDLQRLRAFSCDDDLRLDCDLTVRSRELHR